MIVCDTFGLHIDGEWQEPERLDGELVQRRSCVSCKRVEFRTVLISRPAPK